MDLIEKVEFGIATFDKNMMKKSLPYPVYLKWKQAFRKQDLLDKETADMIAHAMKEWAIDNGATHFCHWFQPLNGLTAKKHEAFIDRSSDNEPIARFSGSELIKSEPDASSFPNGGMRSTFEARGYTYWDCTANTFIMDNIMYIPSIFVSFTGETLDKKLPLLKSLDYLSEQATNLVNLICEQKVYRARVSLGLEQEFFLVGKDVYERRMDLKTCGRTLHGVEQIKTQDQDNHYMSFIPKGVMDFYEDVNAELWKLGIYAKTEHNEAAPGQFEIASLYGEANITIDQNHIIMEVLKKTALKHHMVCLLHEKPFQNVNGSGKHNNYSIVTNEGLNLFDPNGNKMLFTLSVLALMKATKKYPTLLRVASSSVRNDFRLGGAEAPPAIISIYLGNYVEDIIYERSGIEREAYGKSSNISINNLGYLPHDNTDRNRTSPFAFTGNKFEFRMLGSSLSASDLNIALNTIIGESFGEIYDRLSNVSIECMEEEVNTLIREMLIENQDILFGGDNYSNSWIDEAKRRNLPNHKTYLDALSHWKAESQVFVQKGIFTENELNAIYEIMVEETISYYEIETRALMNILQKNVEPAVMDEMIRHGEVLNYVENSFLKNQLELLNVRLEQALKNKENILENLGVAKHKTGLEKALYLRDNVINLNLETRNAIDGLENLIGETLWTIPSYEEIFNSIIGG